MVVILIYLALVAAGEVVAFFIGNFLDSLIPSAWSMVFAMALFFGVIAAMWPVAVWVTEKWFVGTPAAK